MIDKEFAPHPEALELKQLGFDEPCFGYYGVENEFVLDTMRNTSPNYSRRGFTSAPLYQQAFRFFREKYSWQHSIDATSDQHCFELGYNYWIWNNKTGEEHHTMPKNRPTGDWEYETYKEAELECLRDLIKILKGKNNTE